MNLQATMELDSEYESLQAQLAEAYGALAAKERELADLRASWSARGLAEPRADSPGGKTEQAGRS